MVVIPYYNGLSATGIADWSASRYYAANDLALLRGHLYRCVYPHTSSSVNFTYDIQRWASANPFTEVVYLPSHGFARYTGVYKKMDGSWATCDGMTFSSLPTHIILDNDTTGNYFIAATSGTYLYPSHGITVNAVRYADRDTSLGTTSSAFLPFLKEMWVADTPDTIKLLVDKPATMQALSYYNNTGYFPYYRLLLNPQASDTTYDIPIDGDYYPHIRVECYCLDSGTPSGTKEIFFQVNGDTGTNYSNLVVQGYGSAVSVGATNTADRFLIGAVDASVSVLGGRGSLYIANISLKNTGNFRPGTFWNSRSDDTYWYRQTRVVNWLNTSSKVTYLRVTVPAGTSVDLWINAKMDV